MSDSRRVAIACQGGGSHTAFTGGVLAEALPRFEDGDAELVGLSGTSGGAFSAVAGWYGLRAPDETAPGVLEALWSDIAARGPSEEAINDALVFGTQVETMGFPVPEFSPYQVPFTAWGQSRLRRTLEDHVDFDGLPRLVSDDAPRLVVGAVDITAGEFRTFVDGEVTVESVLASAAVPELFEAVEIDGDAHWDGVFSQNPPIRDLYHVPVARKPEELWVVQINPQTRDDEPRSLRAIADRRNELAGNLSLNQELRFVERMNELLEQGHLPDDEYTRTEVRRIQLDRELDYASKLNRNRAFIEDLFESGRERVETILR